MKHLILLCITVFIFQNCKRNSTKKEPHFAKRISFSVDSFQIYSLPINNVHSFQFSPIAGQDKIWVTKRQDLFELDLKTNLRTPLSDIFCTKISKNGRLIFWKDEFSNDVYFDHVSDYLLQFQAKNDTIIWHEIKELKAILIQEKEVFIGTNNGLFALDKETSKVNRIQSFPAYLEVNNLAKLSLDSVTINQRQFIFDLKNDTLLKQKYWEAPKRVYEKRHPLTQQFPRGGWKNQLFDSITWFHNKDHFFFSKNDSLVFEIDKYCKGKILHLEEGVRHLFLLYPDKFLIFNKDFIQRKAVIFDVAEYQSFKLELDLIKKNLYKKIVPVDTFLEKVDSLKEQSKYQKYPELQKFVNYLPNQYFGYLCDSLRRTSIEKGILNNSFIGNYRKLSLEGLTHFYINQWKFKEGFYYYKLLKKEFPKTSGYFFNEVVPCLILKSLKLDSLGKVAMPEDQRLFQKAQITEDLIYCGLSSEMMYDLSNVQKIYKQLLHDFPESDYADDAQLYLLKMENYGYEDINYSPELVQKYRDFIRRFPNSELISQARYFIAFLCTYAGVYMSEDGTPFNEKENLLDVAEKELNKIKPKLNKFDSTFQNQFWGLKDEIERMRIRRPFELSIQLRKQIFSANEPIILDIQLMNNSSNPQKIQLFESPPYFSSGLSYDRKYVYFSDTIQISKKQKEFIIQPDQPFKQSINLRDEMRHWDKWKVGCYEFGGGKVYSLKLFAHEHLLHSNFVKFYMK